MEMNGMIEVTVGNVTIKTGSEGRHYASFNAELAMGEKRAEEILGAEFRAAAFGSRHKTIDPSPQGDATVERLGYHSFKPPKWMKFEAIVATGRTMRGKGNFFISATFSATQTEPSLTAWAKNCQGKKTVNSWIEKFSMGEFMM